MSIEVGTAYISILPSTEKLAPGIRQALGKAEGDARAEGQRSGSSFASSFKASMGRLLKGGLIAGAATVGGLGILGVKTAADLEQAEIAFTTMLGSGEKAKAFIGDLTDFAAKTPFEFPGLQSAASSLISAGIATRDVLPIMKTLGDVTSGMGTGAEGVQRATIALQQMSAAGRITGEDLNQLRDAGIPVYDLLAAATGKSKAEVVALAQAGKLGSKELGAMMNALKTGDGLERFSGLMEKQSASLTGMWSTFKDTLGQGMAQAIKPLIPLLKQGLGKAAEALPPILTRVADGLKSLIEFSIDAVKWGKEHKTVLEVAAVAVASLVAGFLAFNVVTGVTAAVKGFRLAILSMNAAILANPVALIVAAVVALGLALFVAWKKSETFRNIVTGALDKVKGAGKAVADFFTKSVPDAFGKVKDAAGKAIGWVKQNWPKILAVLTGPIGLAVLAITKNWDKIKSGAGAAKDWIVKRFNDLLGWFRALPGRMSSAVAGLWDGLKNGFRAAINAIIGWWNGFSLHLNIPDKIPGLPDSFTIDTPNVTPLAKGGILNRPTFVAGEAGAEVVAPLDRFERFIEKAYGAGAANADARHYTNPSPVERVTATRTEFVITNWRTGEGYFREIAEDTYHGEDEFAGSTRRMQ